MAGFYDSFVGGQRNALARQASEQSIAQNALASQQEQSGIDAKQTLAEVQWALQAPDPVAAVKSLPHIAAAWQKHGVNIDTLDPEHAKALLQEGQRRAASQLGMGPPQETFGAAQPIQYQGQNALAQIGSGGTVRPIQGAAPIQPPADRITKYQQAQLDIEKQKLDEQRKLNNPFGVSGSNPASAAPGVGTAGDEGIKNLPQNIQNQVKALADGRMQFPSGMALKSPYWQQMLSAVAQYDPTFDAINYNSRARTRTDFTSGKSAMNIKALNTAIGHAGTLWDQISGTASHGLQAFNYLQNKSAELTGSAGPTKFKQTAGALASELTQVFRGSGGAEADVKRYLDELNVNASDEQKRAAVKNIIELLYSRTAAIGDQYNKGMGKSTDPLLLLDSHAQGVLNNIANGQAAPPETAPAGVSPDVQALLDKYK